MADLVEIAIANCFGEPAAPEPPVELNAIATRHRQAALYALNLAIASIEIVKADLLGSPYHDQVFNSAAPSLMARLHEAGEAVARMRDTRDCAGVA